MKMRIWLGALLLCVSQMMFAVQSPVVVLQNTADKVIAELKKNKATLTTNRSLVLNIVNRLMVPEVDVTGMSRSVLGRDAWTKANPEQRKRFSKEFTQLVVRTYSGALAQFNDDKVEFFPVRGGYEGKSRVQVESKIIRANGPAINMSYRVVLKDDGWKVYDMTVEGISLLQSFRSQFTSQLSHGNLDSLTNSLAKHNSRK